MLGTKVKKGLPVLGQPNQVRRYDSLSRGYGRAHACGIGDALTRNIEGCAVIYGRAHHRYTQRRGGGFVEIVYLDRDVSLVVIQSKHHIKFARNGSIEY